MSQIVLLQKFEHIENKPRGDDFLYQVEGEGGGPSCAVSDDGSFSCGTISMYADGSEGRENLRGRFHEDTFEAKKIAHWFFENTEQTCREEYAIAGVREGNETIDPETLLGDKARSAEDNLRGSRPTPAECQKSPPQSTGIPSADFPLTYSALRNVSVRYWTLQENFIEVQRIIE